MRGKEKKDKPKQNKHLKHQKESNEKKLKEEELGKIHGGLRNGDISLDGGAGTDNFPSS